MWGNENNNRPQRKKSGPPPLHERINAIMAGLIFLASLIVGSSFEYIGGLYVRGPCAILCVIALMVALYYPARSIDEAIANDEDIGGSKS